LKHVKFEKVCLGSSKFGHLSAYREDEKNAYRAKTGQMELTLKGDFKTAQAATYKCHLVGT
jgi:hypothetical protein